MEIIEPKLFSGQELGVVDILPNIIKRTLIMMNVDDDKDQDEIIDRIKLLVKIGEEKGEKRKEKTKEKEKERGGSVDDVWK